LFRAAKVLKIKLFLITYFSLKFCSPPHKKSPFYKRQADPIASAINADRLREQLAEIGVKDTQFVTENQTKLKNHMVQ
jgi:hypothetical protein